MHEQPNDPTPDILNPRRAMLAGIGGLAAGAFLASNAKAGPLTPPAGPIASTPGPEPRIPISDSTTPGNSTCLFRITQPGSYYLTGNVQAPPSSTKHGIIIQSDGVTIDLMGFALTGVSTSGDGIRIETNSVYNALAIRNGTVNRWGGFGINLRAPSLLVARQAIVDRVRASNNQQSGIDAGSDAVVRGCVAESNAGIGIISIGGVFEDCSADRNAASGISGALLASNCCARENGSSGFVIAFGGIATNCTAISNAGTGFSLNVGCLIEGCVAYNNSGYGVQATTRSIVERCTVSSSGRSNIIVTSFCTVRGVTSCTAGQDEFAAAILVTGSANRIEDNHCIESDVGIQVQGTGNFIARNTSSDNFSNWIVAAGNTCLVVQAATSGSISGNAGGTSPGSTNPNTNYTH